MPPAAPAGVLIAAAIHKQKLEKRTLARERVDQTHPGINGQERKAAIERYRRALVRWTNPEDPTEFLSRENAAWIGPRLGIPVEDLTREELSPAERRLREARRLERKARELRRQLGR